MAGRLYPNDYRDRKGRISERERQRQIRNDAYRARGWPPDVDRDSVLGEYYPTEDYQAGMREDYLDPLYLTAGEIPRSMAGDWEYQEQDYPDYGLGDENQEYHRGRPGTGYQRHEIGSSSGGYARHQFRSEMERRRGYGQAARMPSGNDTYGRGDFYRGYAGPDYGRVGATGERYARAYRGYPGSQARQATEQPNYRGYGPKGYQRSDTRIQEDICERLTDDPSIDASDVTVTVSQGVVTLEGSVVNRAMKHHAENIVADCTGVKDINNRLTPKGGLGGSTTNIGSTMEGGPWSSSHAASSEVGAGTIGETSSVGKTRQQ